MRLSLGSGATIERSSLQRADRCGFLRLRLAVFEVRYVDRSGPGNPVGQPVTAVLQVHDAAMPCTS